MRAAALAALAGAAHAQFSKDTQMNGAYPGFAMQKKGTPAVHRGDDYFEVYSPVSHWNVCATRGEGLPHAPGSSCLAQRARGRGGRLF